jgi:TetR/AcrR family transcriptional regulator, lmrAB and yxaGH operons repressor
MRPVSSVNAAANSQSPRPAGGDAPAAVIDGVSRTFRRFGYEGATMRLLSEGTGLGRSSLYHYFPNGKVEMAHAALDCVERFLQRDFANALAARGPSRDRIGPILKLLLDYYEEGSIGCLLGALRFQDCPEDIARRVAALTELWIGIVAEFFEARGDGDARAAAERAVILIQGALIVVGSSGRKATLRRTFAEAFGTPVPVGA